jgi:eukaryotic-like serine/threonine-protein kinase
MGRVWRARDELLDRDVAMKEIRFPEEFDEADKDELQQRQLREARSAARLSHPAVATVFDVVEELGRPWIVMEFVRGRSLDRVLKEQGPLPPHVVARIGQDVLAALAEAHSVGVLHRDVKPSNVLLTRGGGAVLTDFGVATIDGDPSLTRGEMVMGTPAYSAPERIHGQRATAAADLWSLGLTLHAASEGQGPYDNYASVASTIAAIATQDPAPPTNAGPIASAIMALISRDPAARPTAEEAMRMFAEATAVSQPAATTESPAEAPSGPLVAEAAPPAGDSADPEPQNRMRRGRRLVMIAVAAVVVLGGGSLWAVRQYASHPLKGRAPQSAPSVQRFVPIGTEIRATTRHHKSTRSVRTGSADPRVTPSPSRGAEQSLPPEQSSGTSPHSSAPPVAPQANLSSFDNRIGVTSDNGPSTANYDSGNSGYSLQALAADGITAGVTFNSGGLTYRWPSAAPNTPDAIRVSGQTIPVPALPGATVIGFVGSAVDVGSTPATGTVTVTYTDGSTSTDTLTMTDWAYGDSPAPEDTVVATMSYRDEGSDATPTTINMALFSTTISVDSAKTVASVTLPSTVSEGAMGIFCLTVGTS